MKRILLYAALLSVAFLLAGWFLFGPFMVKATQYYKNIYTSIEFVSGEMGNEFGMRLRQTLSWGVLPWFAFFSCWSLVRYKGMAFSGRYYSKALGIILLGYVLGTGARLFWLTTLLDFPVVDGIKNLVPVSVLEVYKWGLAGAVLFSLLYFAVVQPKKLV